MDEMFSRSFRSLSWVLVSQAGEKLRKDSPFRLPHGNGFARTFALRTLGCLMVTAFASTLLFLRDGDSLCRALSQLEKFNREEANAIPLPQVHNVRQPKCLQL